MKLKSNFYIKMCKITRTTSTAKFQKLPTRSFTRATENYWISLDWVFFFTFPKSFAKFPAKTFRQQNFLTKSNSPNCQTFCRPWEAWRGWDNKSLFQYFAVVNIASRDKNWKYYQWSVVLCWAFCEVVFSCCRACASYVKRRTLE